MVRDGKTCPSHTRTTPQMIRSKTLTLLKYSACRWGPKGKQRNGGVRTREAGSLVLLLRASSYFPFLLLSVCSFSLLLPVIAPQRGRSVSNETHNTTAVPVWHRSGDSKKQKRFPNGESLMPLEIMPQEPGLLRIYYKVFRGRRKKNGAL